jgi:hypothetical protein
MPIPKNKKSSRNDIVPEMKRIVTELKRADRCDDAAERLLFAIRDLDAANPFMLAAAIDWIRIQWKATTPAAQLLADGREIDLAIAWIVKRSQELYNHELGQIGASAVVAAVQS